MAVFRIERTRNYTVMSNRHLRDMSLSLRAKGLLSQMLSLPEDWDYTLAGLARINAEGKDAIRAAIRELEGAGYIVRRRARDARGCLRGTEYVIFEQPQPCDESAEDNNNAEENTEDDTQETATAAADGVFFSPSPTLAEPALEEPTLEKPTLEKPTLGNPTQLNKDSTKYGENKILTSRSIDSILFPSLPPQAAEKAETCPREAKGRETRRERKATVCVQELDAWREVIREQIDYDNLLKDRPFDAGQVDELVELVVETVCSRKETLRVRGESLPQAVVKSRLLKLDGGHIRFVLDCLRENTTKVRNIRQYLLATLYNAPFTVESHYAAQVSHDLYGAPV